MESVVDPKPQTDLLKTSEAAAILRVSLRWIYRHWKDLPFSRKLAPRVLRFDRAGLERWVARKRPDLAVPRADGH